MPQAQLKSQDAKRIAHDLAIDLATAAWLHPLVHALARKKDPQAVHLTLTVDCLFVSSIVVTLSKFCEFHDRFASILPEGLRRESGKLKADLVSRGLLEFRSKYLAHVWDDEASQPLATSQVDDYVGRITGVVPRAEWLSFLRWLAY